MAVWSTSPITSTATGTGTAETADVAFSVPSNAVEIIAVRGHVHATNGDPAESILGVFKIKGQDFGWNPYEWFSEIGPAKLGAVDQTGYAQEPRWWKAYLPTVASSQLAVSYEPLDALANNGQFKIDVSWSSTRTGLAPIQRLCSRETATSTSTGPSLTLSGAERLVEYCIAVSTSTVAADDPSNGKLQVVSGGLEGQQLLELTYNIHSIEATSGIALTSLMYDDVDIPFQSKESATFASTFTIDTALGTAGQYAYSLAYVPVRKTL